MKSIRSLVICACLSGLATGSLLRAEEGHAPVPVSEQTQEIVVEGVVLDENNLSLVGVAVLVEGTQNIVPTDLDGIFSIRAHVGDVLRVSMVGYQTMFVPVADAKPMTLKMKVDRLFLDDVVVIGYGTQKKKLVTGSTLQITGEEIQRQHTVNPIAALQSLAPGVNITKNSGQPGSSYKVNIRGIGTIGDSEPLYIIDGYSGSMSDLNPSDIASIDVLKDAASAAIYGARGANGVVLITTKSGRVGKPVIEYNMHVGVQQYVDKVQPLGARDYAMIMAEAYTNDGKEAPDFAALVPDWDKIQSGEWDGTNWINEMINNYAPIQYYSLSVRGGTKLSTYSVSASYTDQEGTVGKVADPRYRKFTATMNGTQVLVKGRDEKHPILKMGENLRFIYDSYKSIQDYNWGSYLRLALQTNPFMPLYDDKGNYHYSIDWYPEDGNPIALMDYKQKGRESYRLNLKGEIFLEIQPIKNLVLRTSTHLSMNTGASRSYIPEYDLGPSIKQFQQHDEVTQSVNNAWAGFNNNKTTLSYKGSVKGHNFDALLGFEFGTTGNGYSVKGTNINCIFDDFEHGYLDNCPKISEDLTKLAGSPVNPHKSMSFFGRLNYDYKEKYMVGVVMRADGSSKFARGHRWGYFPSVSAGWAIANEEWMQGASSWLNLLKIRASWGQNGNNSIPSFQYLSSIHFDDFYNFGTDKNTIVYGGYPYNVANNDVKWETSEQTDVGLDARMFDGRLNFAFDWYNKMTKDWLLVAPIQGIYGAEPSVINGGDIRNTGVEIGISWRDDIGDFSYGVNLNLAHNKNMITRIANTEGIIHGSGVWNGCAEVYRAQVGYPIGYFWGYKTDGLFQTQADIDAYTNSEGKVIQPQAQPGDLRFQDLNDDGVLDDNDKTMIGDPNPDLNFSFNVNLAYKGFDLNIATNGVWGNQIFKAYRHNTNTLMNYTTDILGRWHGEGTSTTVPRVSSSGSPNDLFVSDRFVEDAWYWRVADVTIGYDFKHLFPDFKAISQLRLFFTGQNLGILTPYSGFDPEVGGTAGVSWAQGIDFGMAPSARTFMVGLSVRF